MIMEDDAIDLEPSEIEHDDVTFEYRKRKLPLPTLLMYKLPIKRQRSESTNESIDENDPFEGFTNDDVNELNGVLLTLEETLKFLRELLDKADRAEVVGVVEDVSLEKGVKVEKEVSDEGVSFEEKVNVEEVVEEKVSVEEEVVEEKVSVVEEVHVKNETIEASVTGKTDQVPFDAIHDALEAKVDGIVEQPIEKIVKLNKRVRARKGKARKSEYAQYLGLQPTLKFKCDKCTQATFPTLESLNEHLHVCTEHPDANRATRAPAKNQTNFKITRKVYLCSACGTYYEIWNLFLHMRQVHHKHICLLCLGLFTNPEKLSCHLTVKHQLTLSSYDHMEDLFGHFGGEFIACCCTCERLFDENDDFENHVCGERNVESLIARVVSPTLSKNKMCSVIKNTYLSTIGSSEIINNEEVFNNEVDCRRGHDKLEGVNETNGYDRSSEESFNTGLVIDESRDDCEFGLDGKSHHGGSDLIKNDKLDATSDDESLSDAMMIDQSDDVSNESTNKIANTIPEILNGETNGIQAENTIINEIPNENEPITCNEIVNDTPKTLEIIESVAGSEPVVEKNETNLSGKYSILSNLLNNSTNRATDVSCELGNLIETNPNVTLEEDGEKRVPKVTLKIPKIIDDVECDAMEIECDLKNVDDDDDDGKPNDEAVIEETEQMINPEIINHVVEEEGQAIDGGCEPSIDESNIQIIELGQHPPLDRLPIDQLLKHLVRITCHLCIYCNHARKIAVDGCRLAAHLTTEHRFSAIADSITAEELVPGSFIQFLNDHKHEVANVYINVDDDSFQRVFECFQCRFVSRVHKELCGHNRRFHTKPMLLCVMCKSSFFTYSELICHLCPGDYIDAVELTFRCCVCAHDNIPSSFRLMVHLRKIHHMCDVCLEMCGTQLKLSGHVWKHKLLHLCYRCNIAYRNKEDITKHLFWKHGTQSVQCKRCLQKKWPHVYHFCTPATTFTCDTCSVNFTRPIALKVHKRLHTGEIPYACTEPSCTERFVSRKLLAKHTLAHREPPVTNEPIPDAKPIDEKIDEDKKEAQKIIDVYEAIPALNLSEDSDSDDDSIKVKNDEQQMDGERVENIWDTFHSFHASKDADKCEQVETITNDQMNVTNDLSSLTETYEPNAPEQIESTGPEDMEIETFDDPRPRNEPDEAIDASIALEFIEHDHDYFSGEPTEPLTVENVARLDKTHSSDTESSSCTCGTNCSCSSSSSDSDSSSSSSSSDSTRDKRKKHVSETVDVVTEDATNPRLTAPLIVYESDLYTDESDTDAEEFYDACPLKFARQMQEEKRNQLLLDLDVALETSGAISPSLNGTVPYFQDGGSVASGNSPTRALNGGDDAKTKAKRKRRKGLKKTTPRKQKASIGETQVFQGHHVHETVPVMVNEPVVEPSGFNHTPHTPGSYYDPNDSDKRQSKRRRVPNKFYGYSSGDDEPHTPRVTPQIPAQRMLDGVLVRPMEPPQLNWNEDDLPSSNRSESPATVSLIGSPTPAFASPAYQTTTSPVYNQTASQRFGLMTNPTTKGSPLWTKVLQETRNASASESDAGVDSDDNKLQINPVEVIGKAIKRRGGTGGPTRKRAPKGMGQGHRRSVGSKNAIASSPLLQYSLTRGSLPPSTSAMTQNGSTLSQLLTNRNYVPNNYDRFSLPSSTSNFQHTMPAPVNLLPTSLTISQAVPDSNVYCYCQCPYDEVSEMIACDGKNCKIEWFHFECVGIVMPPKGKWYCPDCRKSSLSARPEYFNT